jgi:hypothetical protein
MIDSEQKGLLQNFSFRISPSVRASMPVSRILPGGISGGIIQTDLPLEAPTVLEPEIQHDLIQESFALIHIGETPEIAIASEKCLLNEIFSIAAIMG